MGVHHTYDEIFGLVKKLLNPNLVIDRGDAPSSPFLRSPLAAPYDASLIFRQLGFKPNYNMEDAILDYADVVRASS